MKTIRVTDALVALAQLRSLGEQKYTDNDGKVVGYKAAVVFPGDKIKTSYWLARLQDKLESIEKTYNKQLQALFEQYGTEIKDKDDKPVLGMDGKPQLQVDFQANPQFLEEQKALQDATEDVSLSKAFKIEDFDGIPLSTDFFKALLPFIDEEATEPETKTVNLPQS